MAEFLTPANSRPKFSQLTTAFTSCKFPENPWTFVRQLLP
ncbi:hypothetical protein JMJ77_0014905 [Colletotrichum scovillei]|uniref:Uncharacterized protein n=1 Tax=Colletotrichum scovillei TaxID=1209932 RepID=A0A9P7QZI2_9PEZI|nr:hypothetical protein JMJ77_0014905 [Colletotrichum scovillei]KAG7056519.1 hypothetical protein JMJ78_0000317 [Colletotrichum scovillei]KAG7066447.1 hypothetical protein JMJ76_0000308 [Colletotrichum scovillei]